MRLFVACLIVRKFKRKNLPLFNKTKRKKSRNRSIPRDFSNGCWKRLNKQCRKTKTNTFLMKN